MLVPLEEVSEHRCCMAYLQRCSGAHVSMGQGSFGGKRWEVIMLWLIDLHTHTHNNIFGGYSQRFTFLLRTLSFSTTPSSRLTTESTAGQLLKVFSSSATTIVTWLVSRSMFFCAARKRLFRVSYGTWKIKHIIRYYNATQSTVLQFSCCGPHGGNFKKYGNI